MGEGRIGVCSWSLPAHDPVELVQKLRAIGLSAAQLALSPILREPARWGGSIPVLQEAGVRLMSGMMSMAGEDYSTLQSIARTGGVRPDETWPENRAHAAAVAGLAAEAGISLVTFHAGFIPEGADDPERSRLLDRLRQVVDLFDACGVAVAFETGQETAETLLAALEELDRPSAGVNFDPANMLLYGMGDPVQALRRLAPFVRQIHVKDALPSPRPGAWGSERPVGDGAVDWPAFFDAALRIRPPVTFVIEREAGADRLEDIATAARIVRRHLDAAAR